MYRREPQIMSRSVDENEEYTIRLWQIGNQSNNINLGDSFIWGCEISYGSETDTWYTYRIIIIEI